MTGSYREHGLWCCSASFKRFRIAAAGVAFCPGPDRSFVAFDDLNLMVSDRDPALTCPLGVC